MILTDEQKGYKQGNTKKSQDERCFTWTCARVLKWYWKMVFGMDKCAVLGIKKKKKFECSEVELPSGDMN